MPAHRLRLAAGAAVTGVLALAVMLTFSAAPALANTDNTLTAQDFSAVAGVSTGPITVATFTDIDVSCTGSPPDTLTATIDWGDGSAIDTGTVSFSTCGDPIDTGTITGSHTYSKPGPYTVTVTFDDFDNDSDFDEGEISSTSTATVAPLGAPQAAQLVSDSAGLGPGKALTNKALAIQAAVDAGDAANACADITDYLGLVNAQTGKKLSSTEANQLTSDAMDLDTTLGC